MKHGLALCCGVAPTFRLEGGCGHYACGVCGKDRGGWSTNQQWIASLWNQRANPTTWTEDRKLVYGPVVALDAGPEWRYAELDYLYHPPYGQKQETSWDFVLFSIDEREENTWCESGEGWECIINGSRCFKEVACRRWDGSLFTLAAPPTKRSTPAQIFVSRSWSTDNAWWYRLSVHTYNPKWDRIMREILGI